ncbi:MAG: hypothetical protein JO212_20140, partial [Acetobacteraceae bacterium]|nr:hypothetical protein [Acetobacteraceae bacterium]
TKICFVIAAGKSDIMQYYGGAVAGAPIAYVIQDQAHGLCDAIFRALPLIDPREPVMVGLPDTIWFPADALASLPDDRLSFLLFPVARPELFDAVETDAQGQVLSIQVKSAAAASNWIWGAFKLPGSTLHALHALWRERGQQDQYVGTLINAWIACGNAAWGARAGTSYVDVGTLNGYREAVSLLAEAEPGPDLISIGTRAKPSARLLETGG